MRTKVDKEIKLNQILRDEIEKKTRFKTKYIAIKSLRIKFHIINKLHNIFKFFTTSGKCFSFKIKRKHFLENKSNFSLTGNVFR